MLVITGWPADDRRTGKSATPELPPISSLRALHVRPLRRWCFQGFRAEINKRLVPIICLAVNEVSEESRRRSLMTYRADSIGRELGDSGGDSE
jgi:hypothetical protein